MTESNPNNEDEEIRYEIKKLSIKGMLEDFQKKLSLEHWNFEIIYTVLRPVHGSITFDESAKNASILINIRDDLKEIRKTIFHELQHLLLVLYTQPLHAFYQNQIKQAFDVHEETFCRRMEGLFDEE